MIRFGGLTLILSVLLCGPVSAQDRSFVVLLAAQAGQTEGLTHLQPPALGPNGVYSLKEKRLLTDQDFCGAPGPSSEALGTVLLSAAIKSGITKLLTAFDERIRREIEAHSSAYETGVWRRLGVSGADFRCLRLIRGRVEAGQRLVDLDLVMSIAVTPRHDAVAIHPLRLYYAHPAPPRASANDRYGLVVSLAAHAIAGARDEALFDTVVLAETVHLKSRNKPFVRYYGSLSDGQAFENIPRGTYVLPPKDLTADPPLAPLVQLTASVVETGAPSRFLRAFSQVYGENKDAIGDALIEAALARIDGE